MHRIRRVSVGERREWIEALLKARTDERVDEFDFIKVLLALNLTAEATFYDIRFHACTVDEQWKESLLLAIEGLVQRGRELHCG